MKTLILLSLIFLNPVYSSAGSNCEALFQDNSNGSDLSKAIERMNNLGNNAPLASFETLNAVVTYHNPSVFMITRQNPISKKNETLKVLVRGDDKYSQLLNHFSSLRVRSAKLQVTGRFRKENNEQYFELFGFKKL